MEIRIGFEMTFEAGAPTPVLLLLETHPAESRRLLRPDRLQCSPAVEVQRFLDPYGNRCARLVMPSGRLRLRTDGLVWDSGELDPVPWGAPQVPVERLPSECLPYLLASRYCEVDLLSARAWSLFGAARPGWERVAAVTDWVHRNIRYGYEFARPTKTAVETLSERAGVCRDFQHLAITFCRALNIPARYVSGYLGDIGVPPLPTPMDFHAWFEVYLGDRWHPVDARHNTPRIGRVVLSRGRDATDTALTTSFGATTLLDFRVWTDEVKHLDAEVEAEDEADRHDEMLLSA